MRNEGTVKTKKELLFSRLPSAEMYSMLPNGKEQAEEEVKAMTNAILTVVEASDRDHFGKQDFLVYVKCRSGHEFVWDLDGRDVDIYIPNIHTDPLTELMDALHHFQRSDV